jgi:hypothetical protein
MSTATARIIPFPQREERPRPPPHPASVPPSFQKRPGTPELCQFVQGLYLDAQTARNQLIRDRQWTLWEKGYWGDYWPEILPSFKSPIVVNDMKRLILTELSDLTDNAPTVYVAKMDQRGKRDRTLEDAIQAYSLDQQLDLRFLEASVDACIWPCGFLTLEWDPRSAQGQGNILVRARHPATVYPDPYAADDVEWRYVILRDVMDVYEVRSRWPDQGRFVRPDAARVDEAGPLTGPGSFHGRGASMLSPLYPIASPVPTLGQDHRVTVYTCYVQDHTRDVRVVESVDHLGVRKLHRQTRLRYPYGRLLICTQDTVLFDGPNPYGEEFPIVRVVLQPTLHRFWPERSLVADLLEMQRASDKLESLTVENALRMQKAVLLADANSGINQRTFGDIPGQIVFKTPGSEVKWERPPPLPPDLIQHGQRLRDLMARTIGQTGPRQGQGGRGNVSAELNETEISQAQGLTRLRARYLHGAAVRFYRKLFAAMARFYTAPRLLPLVVNEEWKPIMWTPLLNPEQYATHVDPRSFSIQSKLLIKRLSLALAKMGKVDDQTLLETLEFPNATEIAQKAQQQLQLQAAAHQRQQGQKRGGRR